MTIRPTFIDGDHELIGYSVDLRAPEDAWRGFDVKAWVDWLHICRNGHWGNYRSRPRLFPSEWLAARYVLRNRARWHRDRICPVVIQRWQAPLSYVHVTVWDSAAALRASVQ